MPRTKLTYKSQYVTIYLVITRMFFLDVISPCHKDGIEHLFPCFSQQLWQVMFGHMQGYFHLTR